MGKTKIEWTRGDDGELGYTWNPVRGCSRVSEGCRHCYAEAVAARFSGPGLPYEGLAADGKWTGKVKLIEKHLADPLRWTKPRRIFVNSMSDLFHEGISDEDIARIFVVMQKAKQHTFQVLTKRPKRMLEWCGKIIRQRGDSEWFLPNVWLGVSVEDQKTADERIPLLLQTPAAVRFVSAEPLLGPMELKEFINDGWLGHESGGPQGWINDPLLDWVIVGGESGPKARPMLLEWARKIVADCTAAGVAVFVKQLGAAPVDERKDVKCYSQRKTGTGEHFVYIDTHLLLKDRKGGDMAEWPMDLRVRDFPAKLNPTGSKHATS